MDGRFQDGWLQLSGSGIRVFVLGNMGLGWGAMNGESMMGVW